MNPSMQLPQSTSLGPEQSLQVVKHLSHLTLFAMNEFEGQPLLQDLSSWTSKADLHSMQSRAVGPEQLLQD